MKQLYAWLTTIRPIYQTPEERAEAKSIEKARQNARYTKAGVQEYEWFSWMKFYLNLLNLLSFLLYSAMKRLSGEEVR